MDDAKKQRIVEKLNVLAQSVPDGVDVVERYVKTEGFRELLALADEEGLEMFIQGLDGPVILRLREKP